MRRKYFPNPQLLLQIFLIGMYILFPTNLLKQGAGWRPFSGQGVFIVNRSNPGCLYFPSCYQLFLLWSLDGMLVFMPKMWHMTFGSVVLVNAWKFSFNIVIRGFVFNKCFTLSLHSPLTALQNGAVIVIAALPEPADGGVWFASSASMLAGRSWWCSGWSTLKMINIEPNSVSVSNQKIGCHECDKGGQCFSRGFCSLFSETRLSCLYTM